MTNCRRGNPQRHSHKSRRRPRKNFLSFPAAGATIEVNLWQQASEHWQQLAALAGTITAIATNRKYGWLRPRVWATAARRWLAHRATIEFDNQALRLTVEQLRHELVLERQKNHTHTQIEAVLKERLSLLESVAGSPIDMVTDGRSKPQPKPLPSTTSSETPQ